MPYTVLIVDDNRIMRDMVRKAVAMSGLEIAEFAEAGDGHEALDVLRSRWIDLVMLDINMPVMNGEEFLIALRADVALRDTLVVVVSTESSQPRIDRLRSLGAEFIHKPFRPEELVAVVGRLRAADRNGESDS